MRLGHPLWIQSLHQTSVAPYQKQDDINPHLSSKRTATVAVSVRITDEMGLNLKPKHSRNWPNLAPTHRPKSFRHLASNNWCVPKLAAFSESVVLKLATIQLGTMPDHNWYQNWFGLEYFLAASQRPTAQFAVWAKPIAGAKL